MSKFADQDAREKEFEDTFNNLLCDDFIVENLQNETIEDNSTNL